MPSHPDGAVACSSNEGPVKQAGIGDGVRLSHPLAVVLARLIDEARPAPKVDKRCVPTSPSSVTRFGYASGPVDVVLSIGCRAGDVAFVHDHGYALAPLLGSYLEGATDPIGGGRAPDLLALPLPTADRHARRAGDTLGLDGEMIDTSPIGTVLVQSPVNDHEIAVIAAVHRTPTCRQAQVAIQYLPGLAGTGDDFGTISVRNISSSWCELDGPVRLAGWTSGRPVTTGVRVGVVTPPELSPHAAPTVGSEGPAADRLAAYVYLTAPYRDDPDSRDAAGCEPHWVVPRVWHLEIGSDALVVANGRGTAHAEPTGSGGLVTCRGQFGADDLKIATS